MQRRRAGSRGMTLIEVLIAMAVSLVVTLAVYQTFAASEGYRRSATAGGDATFNGSLAMYSLQRELAHGRVRAQLDPTAGVSCLRLRRWHRPGARTRFHARSGGDHPGRRQRARCDRHHLQQHRSGTRTRTPDAGDADQRGGSAGSTTDSASRPASCSSLASPAPTARCSRRPTRRPSRYPASRTCSSGSAGRIGPPSAPGPTRDTTSPADWGRFTRSPAW